jgi:cytochrome c oxidase assembly factor CtaG/cytochrome oxidase Cu insertion factor (SCO1/SenC/PrrC family)
MNYLLDNWSFDPFLVVAVLVAAWHEAGLWRLARKSRPERTRQRRLRSAYFYAGLAVLLLAIESPIDYWAGDYFFVHMIQHLLLMFAAPSLIVAGAPWQPLLAALPARLDRAATRGVLTGGWSRPLRAAGGFLLRPWVSVILFSTVMIAWHVPALFDWAENNQAVHIWLLHGSMLTAGVLFWLQYIPSPPFRRRMPLATRAAALFGTNVVMIMLAMALSIFTRTSVYSVYDHLPGVTLPPFADQQLGASILWVCGDFWALPTMIVIVRQILVSEGGLSAALDGRLRRRSARWPEPRPAAELTPDRRLSTMRSSRQVEQQVPQGGAGTPQAADIAQAAPAPADAAGAASGRNRRAWTTPAACAVVVIVIAGLVTAVVLGRQRGTDALTGQRPPGIPASVSLPTINLMGLSPVPAKAAPGFRLTDQNGRTLALSSLRGKVVVLNFMDPHCTDICPLVSQEFVDAQHDLGTSAGQVVFAAVNVNQYFNRVSDMAAYSNEHQLNSIPSWHFFTGPLNSLQATWRGYGVAVQAPNPNADIVHTSVMYFIGPDGSERYIAMPMVDHTTSGSAYLPAGQIAAWGQGIAQVAGSLVP